MKALPFVKMHGLGNDYVYIDCFQPSTAAMIANVDLSLLAQHVSDRHYGIGSDGLVLMLPATNADAQMRMFNADGTEAQMCGNAIRCVAKYLYESAICRQTQMQIETLAGLRSLTLHVLQGVVELVTVNMGTPTITRDIITVEDKQYHLQSVNMGNPHTVLFMSTRIETDKLNRLGRAIGTHPHFPEGTNVEFVCVRNQQEIDIRVWERGTGETMACGTGACAATVASIVQGYTSGEVTAHLPGGDLSIFWNQDSNEVYLTGAATIVYEGRYYLKGNENKR